MKTLILLVALLGIAGAACAQTPPASTPRPTPPPGPLLDKAPDLAAWSIASQRVPTGPPATDNKPAPNKSAEMVTTITKTNQTRHYVVRHRVKKVYDGSQEEVWQQGPYVVTHESMWKGAQLGFETTQEDTPFADFPEFGWISAANFVGVQSVEGAACLVFDATIIVGGRKSGAGREPGGDKEARSDTGQVHEHACIDLETRLPRLLQNADMVSRYTFQTAPPAMLTLPAADQEMINAYLKNNAQRLQAPQAP